MIRLTEKEFAYIAQRVCDHYGINLNKKKVLIECRMTKELEKLGVSTFGEYIQLLEKDKSGKLSGELVNRLTTNYTYFLREPIHFSILQKDIFPELFGRKGYGACRIWCAGCATGEECYTLAMVLQDWKDKYGELPFTRIIATDISEEVLEKARKALYSRKDMEILPVTWQKKYCHIVDDKYFTIDDKLKNFVQFQCHNLMESRKSTEKYDIIMCRNVMIYFDRTSRMKLIQRLESSLNKGGYLLIGHAELLSREETVLETIYPAVYRKKI